MSSRRAEAALLRTPGPIHSRVSGIDRLDTLLMTVPSVLLSVEALSLPSDNSALLSFSRIFASTFLFRKSRVRLVTASPKEANTRVRDLGAAQKLRVNGQVTARRP